MIPLRRLAILVFDAIAVRVELDEALETALVDMEETEAGRGVIAEDSLFDGVRGTAKIAGM